MDGNGDKPATKADLKNGLDGLETRLRADLASKKDMETVKSDVKRLDEKFSRMAIEQVKMRGSMATKEDIRSRRVPRKIRL